MSRYRYSKALYYEYSTEFSVCNGKLVSMDYSKTLVCNVGLGLLVRFWGLTIKLSSFLLHWV